MQKWSLQLRFVGPYGETLVMAVDLGEDVAQEIQRIDPPLSAMGFPVETFDQVVKILRRKQFRKDLFTVEATRLGVLLAERMEDAEGWHDQSRIEPAKAALRELDGAREMPRPKATG